MSAGMVPDRENFCLLNGYFLWVVFVKVIGVAQNFGLLFSMVNVLY
jgi:hypothetical protein